MKLLHAAMISALTLPIGLASAQEKALSDPQIAGIVVTANQIDIDAGKLAKRRTRSKEVGEFAEQMITDHTAVNRQAAALAKKLNVTPEESAVSKRLKAGAKQSTEKLGTLSGAQFDRAYVEHEVAYHQQVLEAIDQALLPSAKNAELKALITKVRPAIAAHLDHAKMLQSALAKK